MAAHADRTSTELIVMHAVPLAHLFVVHAARYAPISWHSSKRVLISKGATAERCIMAVCFRGRSWCRRLWGQKLKREAAKPTSSTQIWSGTPWAYGCLEGRRREGATLVQQRCQRSVEKAGVTSAMKLHDASNAYLSLYHLTNECPTPWSTSQMRKQGSTYKLHEWNNVQRRVSRKIPRLRGPLA